jgi:AraC family transcriptional regulator of adaptative response/methylated-DNA-[protein]-cysteine methyltransferase
LKRDDVGATKTAAGIFAQPGDSHSQPALRAFVRGTPFQVRVWRALLHLQPGTLTSYARLASAIEQPTAARAVGTAVGQNPLAYLIPCHRVIRETGVLGDYRWGSIRKRAIIAWETSPRAGHGNLIPQPA